MHCGYMDKRGKQCWKIMWQFLIKLSIHLPLTRQFHSRVFTQEKWKHVHTHKKSYKNVHCSLYFIMANSRRMVYSYNGIVFSNKKKDLLIYTTIWVNLKNIMLEIRGSVLRWQRNRTRRPLSPQQIHCKNIWTLSKFHKTTSECWQRTSVTQRGSPLSSKGGRTKYKR